MNLQFEVVVIPVSDVDRARKFYAEALGFRVDVDHRAAEYEKALGFRRRGGASYRIVQLTPPGSECSIHIGTGITQMTPGSLQGMHLVSSDIEATRAELVARGVEVSEPSTSGRKDRHPASNQGAPTTTVTCRSATRTATAG